jgi:hypothetical protein
VTESNRIQTLLSVGPLVPFEGPGLASSVRAAIEELAPPDIVLQAVRWDEPQNRLVVDLISENVTLDENATPKELVAAVQNPALELVNRSVAKAIPNAANVAVRVFRGSLLVEASRIERIPPRPGRWPLQISWYRVVLELTKLGAESLETIAYKSQRELEARSDYRHGRAFVVPERNAIGMIWETEGYDEEQVAEEALWLAENIVTLAGEISDKWEMQIVGLGHVRPPN